MDKYSSMSALLAALPARGNYGIHADRARRSRIKIFAPHGGCIEPCTEPIALAIAGERYDCFVFSGRRASGCFAVLHVTSTRYDEPQCLSMAEEAELALAIHGCEGGEAALYVGGGNEALAADLLAHLSAEGFPAKQAPADMAGGDVRNFVNRARLNGIQLELSAGFRKSLYPSFPKTLQRDALLLSRFVESVRLWLTHTDAKMDPARPA